MAAALGAAVDAYLDSIQVENTKATYRKALDPLAARFGRDTPLAGLEPRAVAGWLEQRWGRSAPATYNLRVRAVRSASAWWTEQDWITGDLTARAKKAKSRPVLAADVLTVKEAESLLRGVSKRYPTGVRNFALLTMMYKSGLRISEALAIRPGDIDHDARSIRLRHTKAREAQTRYYHASAEDALSHWLDKRRELGINGRSPVFCTLAGGEVSAGYARNMLSRLVDRVNRAAERRGEDGITKRVHLHGLRDTFALDLRRQGMDVPAISKLLGHKYVSSTDAYLGKLGGPEAGRALAAIEGTPPDLAAQVAELRREVERLRADREED